MRPGKNRIIHAGYRPTPNALDLACSRNLRLNVRAGVRLKAAPKRVRAGSRVRFRGNAARPPDPQGGQADRPAGVRRRALADVPDRSAPTPRARFRARYRFTRTFRSRTFRFRARARKESRYPYALGVSKVVRVRVRAPEREPHASGRTPKPPRWRRRERSSKSPPELWAEVSDPGALARHLGEFGEIRITRTEPESLVVWEGEKAAGRVELEPSGWGTRVTLTAEAAMVEPAAQPEPAEPPRPGFWARLFRRRAPGAGAAASPTRRRPRSPTSRATPRSTSVLDTLGAAHHRPFSRP